MTASVWIRYQIIAPGEKPLGVPFQLQPVILLRLETLILLEQVELKYRTDGGAEFKGNVLVRVCSAIPSSLDIHSDCAGLFDPLLCTEGKSMQTGPAL